MVCSDFDFIFIVKAIENVTTFVAVDNRHFIKIKQYGSIMVLNKWQVLFE